MQRPDLSKADPEIIAYIEYLEGQLKGYTPRRSLFQPKEIEETPAEPALPAELPTTVNIATISQAGVAKRTPRHLYSRQHRGGMGIFDLDVPAPDFPSILTSLDASENALVFTNLAKVYRLPANRLGDSEVRSKGTLLFDRYEMEEGEMPVAVLPERASGYIALASALGKVRCLRHHLFGEHMRPGSLFFNTRETGPLAAACWTDGDSDLFILTQKGIAIRFSEKALSPMGDWGIKVASDDRVVAITSVYPDGLVFLVASDGKGTVREMTGFAANKSTGGSGKIAMKNDHLVGAVAVTQNDDLFILTQLGKIIRFRADEVPSTDGVVQGVICINMRNDEVVAVTSSGTGRAG